MNDPASPVPGRAVVPAPPARTWLAGTRRHAPRTDVRPAQAGRNGGPPEGAAVGACDLGAARGPARSDHAPRGGQPAAAARPRPCPLRTDARVAVRVPARVSRGHGA